MTSRARVLLLLFPSLLLISACTAQKRPVDRQPAVAGQFYPAEAGDLGRTLSDLFAHALPSRKMKNVLAVIVPHAGYVYSGEVAASGLNQIDASRQYDNVFVIGPSHRVAFEGASVYTAGDFVTPLGTVEVNRRLGEELVRTQGVFSTRTDAHALEHSVEVQIPFLQHILKNRFRLVPIVVGANAPETCKRIAGALRPFLNRRNLFVISTDFSHYPGYSDAARIDRETADAIMSNSADSLMNTIERHDRTGIPQLATSICGWSGVLTLLYMTESRPDLNYRSVQYKNSGDSPVGNRDQVVGYYAIAVTQLKESTPHSGFSLSGAERTRLLAIARRTVETRVRHGQRTDVDPASLSESLTTPCGAFVTLNKHGMLRGCIGRIEATEPLYKVIQEMAIASATQDYRFTPVAPSELDDVQIEISILTPMLRIYSIDEFELGKHGIYIKKGERSGTFLPQVAKETGWTREEFFGHCAQDKAGIGWNGWKDAELYVYEALVFGERER